MREVTIETLRPPERYSRDQIELAAAVAASLNRGRFILTIQPTGRA